MHNSHRRGQDAGILSALIVFLVPILVPGLEKELSLDMFLGSFRSV